MLLGVEIEHEVDEGALEARPHLREHREAGAAHARGPLEIEEPHGRAQIVVSARGERVPDRLAPGANELVVALVAARHARVRQVREPLGKVVQRRVGLAHAVVEGLDLVPHPPHPLLHRSRVAPRLHELPDLAAHRVAIGLELLDLGQHLPALLVEDEPAVHVGVGLILGPGAFLDALRFAADELGIEHEFLDAATARSRPSVPA